MSIHLSYVVPAYNEELLLAHNVGRIVERLSRLGSARVVVVENGSTDGTWKVARGLEGEQRGVPVSVFREERAGLGRAYDRALRELETAPVPPGHQEWILLGAADLPFGFTDLDGAIDALQRADAPPVLLGSKAHPDSRLVVSGKRRAASFAYRWLRRALLGMRVADCQGSVILRAGLAFQLRPYVRSRDYFYTTELVFYAERLGLEVRETPVALAPDERKSTVSLVRDGMRMGTSVLELRQRWRRGGPAVPAPELVEAHWRRSRGMAPSGHDG
ncbi:MAG: glycosyltransferase family 2 protein [Myxococcota bacterium]